MGILLGIGIVFSFWSGLGIAAESKTTLLFEPHSYQGTRGDEVSTQAIGLIKQNLSQHDSSTPWKVDFHFEGETLGRRDVSLDLDRAWIDLPLAQNPTASKLTLGRIHPWDLSHHPDGENPWGLTANGFAQNRGILLGYGYGADTHLPSPLLLGWLGTHYWSDRSNQERVQWGASFTPFFIPSMGSDVTLTPKDPARVGRFGRRPPGTVEVDGKVYPIRFEVDKSRVWEDVLFHPQAMAQLQFNSSEIHPTSQTWLSLFLAPNPEPTFGSKDHLNITNDSVEAYAKISPKYEERLGASLTQKWNFTLLPFRLAFLATLAFYDDRHWGYEVGAESDYLRLSLLDERTYGNIEKKFETNSSHYADLLAQADLKIPIYSVTLYGGVKRHLHQEDLWLRSGVRLYLLKKLSLDMGMDLFGGGDLSYFGEWRTNDRIYSMLAWEFDS